jgi:hypothetical protein
LIQVVLVVPLTSTGVTPGAPDVADGRIVESTDASVFATVTEVAGPMAV